MSEIKLNESLTTMELKKPHPPRLVGGASHDMTSPTPTRIKIQEGYLGSKESQTHTKLPQLRIPVLGNKSLQPLAAKTSGD